MLILKKQNIAGYIKNNLADKLDFIKNCNVNSIVSASGGLISSVYKVNVDGRNIYLKQAIPGRLDKLKEALKDLPDDVFILFNDDRQFAEVKALEILEQAIPNGFTPHLYHHDTENNVMVLSEVCPGGHLFSDIMNEEIDIGIAKTLGKNIALLSNYTYGKIQKLRDDKTEEEIRRIKYKYEVGTVWDKIEEKDKKEKAQKKADDFIKKSLNIYKVLVHGDYHERNIIVSDNQCATFDLEEGHLGDPVEDIGKLAASYCLRIIYFEKIREKAFKATLQLLESFFQTLNIPEDRNELEKRLKVMMAGIMLLRIDGISNKWLAWAWVHKENKKKLTRELALDLILDESKPIKDIITSFYQNL